MILMMTRMFLKFHIVSNGNEAKFRPSLLSVKKMVTIGHLHDYVILLLRAESLRVLLSCTNKGFCCLNLTGSTKFKILKTIRKGFWS